MENETTTVQARMNHPAFAVPGAFEALQALSKAINTGRKHERGENRSNRQICSR